MSNSFAIPWTAACQVPLSMGFSQARILEQVAISFSGGSYQPKDGPPHLLHWQADSLPLSHLGSARRDACIALLLVLFLWKVLTLLSQASDLNSICSFSPLAPAPLLPFIFRAVTLINLLHSHSIRPSTS